jgi:hypothetical protein
METAQPSKPCTKCGAAIDGKRKNWCKACYTAYMRNYRYNRSDSAEILLRNGARSYANVYQRRGKLIPKPCEVCGDPKVEKHHDDYTKPLEVRWLCKRHHAQLTNAA